MARTISDEEVQLKRRARRRLIGAIVLVTAIVVALPMVLDSEPKPISEEVSIQIPSPESGAFTSKVVPLAPAPAAKPAPHKPAAPEPKTVTARPKPAPPAKEPKLALKVEPAKPAEAAPRKESSKAADGPYVVQVIALADAEKAKQMQARIAAAGIRSYTEVVKTAKGDVTRVRVGPFATRGAAEKARQQLKSMGLGGNITAR